MRKGLGRLEKPAFLWMHYARWRLVRAIEEADSRPINLALGKRIAIWSVRADAIREAVLVANTGLAFKAAGASGPRSEEEYEDWSQEAAMHMAILIERFDPCRGFRFSTYAYWGMMRKLFQLKRKRATIQSREESTPEWFYPLDLGAPVLDELAIQDLRAVLKENLADLTARELLVIQHRFGLLTGTKATLDSTGQVLGCTKERARQIQVDALDKLATAFGIEP